MVWRESFNVPQRPSWPTTISCAPASVTQIVEVVKRFSGDPGITDEIHQYAQLGRWKLETKSRDVLDQGRERTGTPPGSDE